MLPLAVTCHLPSAVSGEWHMKEHARPATASPHLQTRARAGESSRSNATSNGAIHAVCTRGTWREDCCAIPALFSLNLTPIRRQSNITPTYYNTPLPRLVYQKASQVKATYITAPSSQQIDKSGAEHCEPDLHTRLPSRSPAARVWVYVRYLTRAVLDDPVALYSNSPGHRASPSAGVK